MANLAKTAQTTTQTDDVEACYKDPDAFYRKYGWTVEETIQMLINKTIEEGHLPAGFEVDDDDDEEWEEVEEEDPEATAYYESPDFYAELDRICEESDRNGSIYLNDEESVVFSKVGSFMSDEEFEKLLEGHRVKIK